STSQEKRNFSTSTSISKLFSAICRILSYTKVYLSITFGYSFIKSIRFWGSFDYYCLFTLGFIRRYFVIFIVLYLCKQAFKTQQNHSKRTHWFRFWNFLQRTYSCHSRIIGFWLYACPKNQRNAFRGSFNHVFCFTFRGDRHIKKEALKNSVLPPL